MLAGLLVAQVGLVSETSELDPNSLVLNETNQFTY